MLGRAMLMAASNSATASSYDTDAQTYITAVETADGSALETAVKDAINTFVVGCKDDGIWSAIKASCILAGARTLTGALVPLVGTPPTNNNFVDATDYNRKTGLAGNGSNKYVGTGRADNADPQNNFHFCVWVSTADSRYAQAISQAIICEPIGTQIAPYSNTLYSSCRSGPSSAGGGAANATGFLGCSRSSSSAYTFRRQGGNATVSVASRTTGTGVFGVLGDGSTGSGYSAARVAFYSIGESLALSSLDTRITALLTAFGAAIS
jgi:hypothetical protein